MDREIFRQALVRGALGAAAAGTLSSACRSQEQTGPGSPSTATNLHDWATFAAAIDGHVVVPADGGYASAKSLFNTRFGDSTPAAVVAARSVADVPDQAIAASCWQHPQGPDRVSRAT